VTERLSRLLAASVIITAACAGEPHPDSQAAPTTSLRIVPNVAGGDLLLVKTATRERLAGLVEPAARAVDFLAAGEHDWQAELRDGPGGPELAWRDDGDEVRATPIDPRIAALLRARERLEVARRAADTEPVQTPELMAAFAHPTGVAAVRAMFEAVYARPPIGDESDGGPSWFESGGIALLHDGDDGRPQLALVPIADPVHELVRSIADADDRQTIEELRHSAPLQFLMTDPNGLLAAYLQRYDGRPHDDRSRRALSHISATLTANTASSYMYDRRGLLAALAAGDVPEGRWAGAWHCHPGARGGAPPSPDDLDVAGTRGRFLTIVYRSDGFDVYDLRAGRTVSARGVRVDAAVRPPDWAAHFASLVSPSEP